MYIQSHTDGSGGIALPRDYHGNAFSRQEAQAPPPPREKEVPEEAPLEGAQAPPLEAESFCHKEEKPQGGSLFDRLPFLSPLLPPTRHEGGRSGLPEWAIIGLVLLLLLNGKEGNNDLLPFVLLLLLWD